MWGLFAGRHTKITFVCLIKTPCCESVTAFNRILLYFMSNVIKTHEILNERTIDNRSQQSFVRNI